MRLLQGWQQSAHTAALTGSSDCLLALVRMLHYCDERTAGSARRRHTRQHRQQRRPAQAERSADGSCRPACQVLDYFAHKIVNICSSAQHCSQHTLRADLLSFAVLLPAALPQQTALTGAQELALRSGCQRALLQLASCSADNQC